MRAQVGERRNDLSVGFNAGMLMNQMTFEPKIKQDYKVSATYGVTMRYVCEKYFSSICAIQMELNYANLGWKELIEDGSGNTYVRNLNYIQMPMLMHMGWGREERGLKFYINAGPQIGLYIDGSEEKAGGVWDTSNRPNGVTYQYGKDIDSKFDYGIAGGLGLELSTSIGHFLLEGRYYYGLGDVFDNSKKGDFARSAHQTIAVKMTYLFDILKTPGRK
jgi:hypothetical protein